MRETVRSFNFYFITVQKYSFVFVGPLKPEISVKFLAVSLIFFISGLSLKTDSVLATFQQYKLHLFIQLFTFVFVPVFLQVLVGILSVFSVDKWILKGFVFVFDCLLFVC